MADAFLHLPVGDRREALGVAADRSGRPAHLLEKDVWVVWALATLYGSALGEHLVFKGGTSLSKAYGVIRRFSEDVDLTYDIRAIAPDLVDGNGEALPKTRSEEKRWSSEVRKRLPDWVAGAAQPVIAKALAAQALVATIRVEGEKLLIDYEATATGSGYVAPSVMLEFGARSTGEPASVRDIACDASGLIEGVTFPTARPRVMHAERTFWEKATARHKAAGRLPATKLIFPNVELRLDVATAKGGFVNLHLFVSPEDPKHVEELRRLLSRLQFNVMQDRFDCTRADLIRLGKKADPNITDDNAALAYGANQFKVNFQKLREVFSESGWAKKNILIAVAGGATDGTSGVREAADQTIRREIEGFAHVIFASSPAQREFWLGQRDLAPDEMRARYGGLKPCLHGSDAHKLDDVA